MDYLLICTVAFLVAILTFFSGFGLGTLLMPAFAVFFPVDIAIALTAIVHFLNNVFKLGLIGKHTDIKVLLLFGAPAVIMAYLGAEVLEMISETAPLYTYELAGATIEITQLKLIIGALILIFALWELLPKLKQLTFSRKFVALGGVLSGFFGGLSGHQGALRSAFLIKAGLTKEAFIATGVSISCFIDASRMFNYFVAGSNEMLEQGQQNWKLLLSAVLVAFLGSFIGRQLIKKVTIDILQTIVGILLVVIALLMGLGII